MLGFGKCAHIWFYIEYSTYTHILVLWINGCQLFRNFMSNATDNKSFGLELTDINEVQKRIDYILDDIYIFFYRWLYDIVNDV